MLGLLLNPLYCLCWQEDGHSDLLEKVTIWGGSTRDTPRLLCSVYTYHEVVLLSSQLISLSCYITQVSLAVRTRCVLMCSCVWVWIIRLPLDTQALLFLAAAVPVCCVVQNHDTKVKAIKETWASRCVSVFNNYEPIYT
jgi:hypothetical protein